MLRWLSAAMMLSLSTMLAHSSGTAQVRVVEHKMSPEELRRCYAAGGTPHQISFFTEGCIRPYADAGKVCTDGDQCEGECIYSGKGFPQAGTEVSGACEAKTGTLSCRALVTKGKFGLEECS